MFAVPRDKVVRIHASSGTTGKPTVVGYTKNDIDIWAQLVARSIRASGARPGDMVHISYGYGLFTGGLGAHYGAEKLGLTVVPFGGGQTERQVQLIHDFKPDIIMVTPSYMLAIADEFERQGMLARESSLRIGIFGAEPWTNEMRREIEQRMGIDAVDIYGLSEVMGPGVANECIETKRPDYLGGPFLPRDYRSRNWFGFARWGTWRTRVYLAHQRSLTNHPLSNPRSHTFAAGDGTHHAEDAKNYWPF